MQILWRNLNLIRHTRTIDDELTQLNALVAEMDDAQELQQDSGYASDTDYVTPNAGGHRLEEEYSDYGSDYGDGQWGGFESANANS